MPLWPAQPWFPAMLHFLAAKPIMLPQSEDLLFTPSSSKKHPLLPQLKLMAYLLSGTASERRAFLMRQPKLSWHPRGHLQDISIYPQSDDGVNFVFLNRYIYAEHLKLNSIEGLNFLPYLLNSNTNYSSVGTARSALSFLLPRNSSDHRIGRIARVKLTLRLQSSLSCIAILSSAGFKPASSLSTSINVN